MKKNKINKPWMNGKSQLRSDKEISEICHDWSMDEWEEYFSTTVDVQRTENLMEEASLVENISQKDYESIFPSASNKKNFKFLEAAFQEIFKNLSDHQRQVLNYLFWEDLNLSEIAKKLCVTRMAIQSTKDRALKRISKLLLQEVARRSRGLEGTITKKQESIKKCINL